MNTQHTEQCEYAAMAREIVMMQCIKDLRSVLRRLGETNSPEYEFSSELVHRSGKSINPKGLVIYLEGQDATDDCIVVDEGKFANPHDVGRLTPGEAVQLFSRDLERYGLILNGNIESPTTIEVIKTELRGKRLAVKGLPRATHASVLAMIANSEEP